MNGLVYKKIANSFGVREINSEQEFVCVARGNLKTDGIFVGDRVEFDIFEGQPAIEKIEKRENQLIRPPLANLEQLIIVIAEVPSPDFMIVDKLILFSLCYGIKPIIVVNKKDIVKTVGEYVLKAYKNVVEHIFFTNAITGEGVDELKTIMRGKLSAFAGQSAVGKSALVNKIMAKHLSEVGEISIKNQKGKNTTRHCEIFFEDDIMITDTAGFTSLDEKLLPLAYYELPYYYPDFVDVMEGCKYKSCTHTSEKKEECAVKRAIEQGLVDKDRYLRYKEIYRILHEKWVKTHG